MKKLLLGLTFAILTATSVQAQQWVSSCGSSSWSKEFFKSNYTFT
jgi:opacity protein-like surface antigen